MTHMSLISGLKPINLDNNTQAYHFQAGGPVWRSGHLTQNLWKQFVFTNLPCIFQGKNQFLQFLSMGEVKFSKRVPV